MMRLNKHQWWLMNKQLRRKEAILFLDPLMLRACESKDVVIQLLSMPILLLTYCHRLPLPMPWGRHTQTKHVFPYYSYFKIKALQHNNLPITQMAKPISPSHESHIVCNYNFTCYFYLFIFYELYTNTLCFACQLNRDALYNSFMHDDKGMKEVLHQALQKN
jgi:hypothetical protein